MKHVKLFEDWQHPTSIEEEIGLVFKKINSADKELKYTLEPSESGKPTMVRKFEDHELEGKAETGDLFVHYTDANGVKKDINLDYHFSYTVYEGRKGDNHLQPDDPNESTLEDLEVTSFGVTDDDGEVIKCEFTPEIHYEALVLLTEVANCDDTSKAFDNELRKLKAMA